MDITKTVATSPITFFAMIALVAGSLTGCTDPDSAPGASGPANETSRIAGLEAGNVGDSNEAGLPDWFAGNFPVHPDLGFDRATSNKPGNFAYYFKAGANRTDEMYDWFTTQYSGNGWEITDRHDNQNAFSAEKVGGYRAQVRVTGVKNVTTIVSFRGSMED